MKWTNSSLKRFFDIVFSFLGLLLLFPLLFLTGIWVWIQLGPPVLFTQVRPGKNGRPFRLCKFRSMKTGEESDLERMTPFGRWLRRSSLDELPELWNILKGDMSFVGPRPLLMAYLERYTPEQARRHEVRPGLSGLAQIQGRNLLSWEEKFARDVWYVDHGSFLLDLQILLLTLFRAGGEGSDPIEPFLGS